ncbi:MAPEG family protein [Providencia stuartii]|uniref:MAPEG family protein n=1 Tax=Providencia manganoxydans TaxID=2923283 RepID=A0ABX7ABI9_9GAMM|nr:MULTISPECIES: MAPEG family protein [Providencia]MDV5225738.1 MAPEG family protein [Providencia rettgeri]ELR5039505.1 MAPEG family protein [Providencia stuartii]ELR5080648.1 MAPEG family protein [Providencia stuartii]ELR5298780.1 MAPEG family protein [Providencia stuartii]MDW7587233.1 MAPEG family protein [Providencia sp. 2023EL-00965]
MVSSLYAVLGALLLIKLSLNVVKLRNQYRVSYGDGGFYELQTAIRVHGNAIEYIPIALILLLFMEMNGAQVWMIHLCGLILIAGRVLHSYGLKNHDISYRRSGMAATYIAITLMVMANIYYLPWIQIFSFNL